MGLLQPRLYKHIDFSVSPYVTDAEIADSVTHPDMPLRDALAARFPLTCDNLPIEGGWGCRPEDAIVISRTWFRASRVGDCCGVEHLVASMAAAVELEHARAEDEAQLIVLSRRQVGRNLLLLGGRMFDLLTLRLTCARMADYRRMVQDRAMRRMAAPPELEKLLYTRAFWFDVSLFAWE